MLHAAERGRCFPLRRTRTRTTGFLLTRSGQGAHRGASWESETRKTTRRRRRGRRCDALLLGLGGADVHGRRLPCVGKSDDGGDGLRLSAGELVGDGGHAGVGLRRAGCRFSCRARASTLRGGSPGWGRGRPTAELANGPPSGSLRKDRGWVRSRKEDTDEGIEREGGEGWRAASSTTTASDGPACSFSAGKDGKEQGFAS
jgi:hypothetical protein